MQPELITKIRVIVVGAFQERLKHFLSPSLWDDFTHFVTAT